MSGNAREEAASGAAAPKAAAGPPEDTTRAGTESPDAARPGRVRVLWLTKGLGRGGAEQLLVNCARHADLGAYDIEVAYVLPYKDALVPALRELGIAVHCLGTRPGPPGATRRPARTWPLRLRRLVSTRGYDLVHTHMPVPAVAARLLAAGGPGQAPLVHTEHNLWHRYRTPTRLANAWTYRRNSAVVAVSHAVADTIDARRLPRGGPGLTVVHHGPDLGGAPSGPAARAAARADLDLPADAFTVGTVANFTPKKDQFTLLEAHALLRRTHPGAMLVLVGSGPLEAALRERAARADLAGSVVFTGSRGDVPALLPAFDVFTLSSRQEGLPVSLMEAMATGLPVVVTEVGGMPEIVADGVEGTLVPPSRPEALARALAAFADDPQAARACGKAALARSESFDTAGAQRRIEGLYTQVLGR